MTELLKGTFPPIVDRLYSVAIWGSFYEVINILIDLYLVLQTIFTKVGAELGTAQPQPVSTM